MKIGYFLSCEERPAGARRRRPSGPQDAGFDALWISDHYHPWNDAQGQSAFVWSVIGAHRRSDATCRSRPAVTCPTVRIHPAIIAQAAATASAAARRAASTSASVPARPSTSTSLGDAVAERRRAAGHARGGGRGHPGAVEGRASVSHRGRHYTVENARVYDLPDAPPPVLVSGFGPEGDRARRPDRRRLRDDVARHGRRSTRYRARGRHGPAARRHQGLLWPTSRTARNRAPAVAERGRARRAGPGPAARRRTSSRRASWSRRTRSYPDRPGPQRARRVVASVRGGGCGRVVRPAGRARQGRVLHASGRPRCSARFGPEQRPGYRRPRGFITQREVC